MLFPIENSICNFVTFCMQECFNVYAETQGHRVICYFRLKYCIFACVLNLCSNSLIYFRHLVF